jgi:hypothetical protein
MDSHSSLAAERDAMDRLGWEASDLWSAAASYGDVGTLDDVRLHLVSGDHLAPAQLDVIAVVLHEALLERGEPSPFA